MSTTGDVSAIINNATDIVQDQYQTCHAYASNAYGTMTETVGEVNEFLDSITRVDLSDLTNQLVFPTLREVPIAVPPRPVIPAVDFPDLVVPDIPIPESTFEYTEQLYSSALRDLLNGVLAQELRDGGTGYAPEYEEQVWTREEERADRALTESIEKFAAEMAARGIDIPDGAVIGGMAELYANHQESRLTTSRGVATKQLELAQKNHETTLNASNMLEQTQGQQFNTERARVLEGVSKKIEFAIAIMRAHVERVNVYVAQYNALAAKANAIAELVKADVTSYAAEADIIAKGIDAQATLYKADADVAKATNDALLGAQQLILQQNRDLISTRLQALTALVQVNAQIASSALTGINVGTTIQAQGQAQESTSTNYNQTIPYTTGG